MNDTSGSRHFGCERVVRVIDEQLRARGIDIVAHSRVRADWRRDRRFMEALPRCHVVVINGEGTLHHGSRHAQALLEVADHPARRRTPIALVNALYQENPPEWRRWLDRIDLVVARDSWSGAELHRLLGRPIPHFGDLSLAEGACDPAVAPENRDAVVVGDSVFRDVTQSLATAVGHRPNVRIIPVTAAVAARRPHFGFIRSGIETVRLAVRGASLRRRYPGFMLCRDERSYLRELSRAMLHVTGRFHGVCLSIVAGTPFLAMRSNSWKVEALLDDCGLGAGRIIGTEELSEVLTRPESFAFTSAERQAIEATLARCHAGAAAMFDDIRRLAEAAAGTGT